MSTKPAASAQIVAHVRDELMRHPPFSRMEAAHVERLVGAASEAYYAPGETIVAPSDGPVTRLICVKSGAVSGRRSPDEARPAFTYEVGDLFPVGALLGARPVAATYTAQGVIEMSNLVPLERSNGLYVTYLINYTHRTSELFRRSDEEIFALYRRDLESLFPKAGRTVVDQFVFRAPFVEPMWTLGYQDARPPHSVIPGRLYLSCTAQLYPRVNSWNSCCEVVEGMLPQLLGEIEGIPAARAAS